MSFSISDLSQIAILFFLPPHTPALTKASTKLCVTIMGLMHSQNRLKHARGATARGVAVGMVTLPTSGVTWRRFHSPNTDEVSWGLPDIEN